MFSKTFVTLTIIKVIANLLHVIKKICVTENNPADVKKYLGRFLTFDVKSSKVYKYFTDL